MKSFSIIPTFAVALYFLVPTAWAAEKELLTFYSDSSCLNSQSVFASTKSDGSSCIPVSCGESSTAGVYVEITCGYFDLVSLSSGYNGFLTYSSYTCETPIGGYWSTLSDGACAADGYSDGSYSAFECDISGYSVDFAVCASAGCNPNDCSVVELPTTECSVTSGGTYVMGLCYSVTYTSSSSSSVTTSSTSSSSSSQGVCFSGDDTVTLESGAAKLFSDLAIGDKIQTADASGVLSFSNVVVLPHAVNNKLTSFVKVVTSSGKSLKATKMHLLQKCDGSLAYAGSLFKGDCLRTVDGDEVVTALSDVKAEGIYTAVTTSDFLVVNGIVASPFGVSHNLMNSYYKAHRIVAKFAPWLLTSSSIQLISAVLSSAFLEAANSK